MLANLIFLCLFLIDVSGQNQRLPQEDASQGQEIPSKKCIIVGRGASVCGSVNGRMICEIIVPCTEPHHYAVPITTSPSTTTTSTTTSATPTTATPVRTNERTERFEEAEDVREEGSGQQDYDLPAADMSTESSACTQTPLKVRRKKRRIV